VVKLIKNNKEDAKEKILKYMDQEGIIYCKPHVFLTLQNG